MAPVIATKPLNLLLPSSPAILINWVGVRAARSGRSTKIVDAGAAVLSGFTITISGAVSGVAAIDLSRRAAWRAVCGVAAIDLSRRAASAGLLCLLRCSSMAGSFLSRETLLLACTVSREDVQCTAAWLANKENAPAERRLGAKLSEMPQCQSRAIRLNGPTRPSATAVDAFFALFSPCLLASVLLVASPLLSPGFDFSWTVPLHSHFTDGR